MIMQMAIKEYLDSEYWKWQSGDRKKTLIQFAEYLGVEYGALTSWMNGTRKPRYENVVKLAEKLGPGIYDVTEFARPGAVGDDLPMPPELGISALEKLRLLISWMKELTEEERLTVLDEALRRKPRGKRVPPVNAERGKRA